MTWREIYRYSINPEIFLDSKNINSLVTSVFPYPNGTVDSLETTITHLKDWRDQQSLLYQKLVQEANGSGSIEALIKTLLIQSVPMASALGCWLQGISAPGIFEDKFLLKQMAIFADDVGVDRLGSSRFDEFKLLLNRYGLSKYAASPYEISTFQSIQDQMFNLPAILFAMSRRSDLFAPDICAIDLIFRTVGILPCWSELQYLGIRLLDWDRLNLGLSINSVDAIDPLTVAQEIVSHYKLHGEQVVHHIECSAVWIANALKLWNGSLLQECHNSIDPQQAMAKLIQKRAREASVYHQDFKLQGCSLSAWMKKAIKDPKSLEKVLSHSNLIKPGNSKESVLVNSLVRFGGPMFRVFNNDELSIIRRWIDWLPNANRSKDLQMVVDHSLPISHTMCKMIECGGIDTKIGNIPKNIRDAYFMLQGRALTPQMRKFAISYIEQWLVGFRHSLDKYNRSLPKIWTPDGLKSWLLNQHDKHGNNFEQNKNDAMPTREAIIDSTLQLAPLTLIDGAWLQGFTDLHLASSKIGFLLFKTYWDELGNGKIVLNHPKIYRDMLRDMGIELAPTGTREFAYDTRFSNDSFWLPVYWLCLGKLPVTFMPEILGMNLAMELSGVGDGYRLAHSFLKHYAFSTQFVDLHNTIDNVITGHSSWAVEAINCYMIKILELTDKEKYDKEWQRIRIGFESLLPLPKKRIRWFSYRSILAKINKNIKNNNDDLCHHAFISKEIA